MASSLWRILSTPWQSVTFSQALQLVAGLGLLLLLLKVISLYFRWKRMTAAFHSFPGPPAHWLFGHIHEHQLGNLDKVAAWAEQYPNAFPLWVGKIFSNLVVTHPEYAKAIYGRSDPKALTAYNFLIPWIGKGLLILSGETWFQHRRLITPAFHYDVLKPYIKLISDSTNVMLGTWYVRYLFCLEVGHRDVDIREPGCRDFVRHPDNPYIRAVYDLSYLTYNRMRSIVYQSSLLFHLSPDGFRFRKACRIAHQHTDKVIAQRKKLLKNEEEMEKVKQKRHPDFLDILLRDEKGRGLSDEDLRAEVDTFMFEGHDTTMSGISWILYCLAKHPEHQKRCREEIQELLGKRDTMEWEDLNKIPYTTMCIKEGLRLYPPVPVVSRELSKPITFYDGRSLPAGTITTLNMYCIHRNSSVWKEPEVFDPLRFSPENSNRHSHAHVPFAAGPRNCIGQNFAMNEMKVAVALTLNRFELSPDLANPPLLLPQIVLRSKNGIHVYLKKANRY
uniref:Cytochrome P450 n=1 Tax=Leptobrachium leishanense TaxID=445787 RepID=A0A8C5QHN5_9ANUR